MVEMCFLNRVLLMGLNWEVVEEMCWEGVAASGIVVEQVVEQV